LESHISVIDILPSNMSEQQFKIIYICRNYLNDSYVNKKIKGKQYKQRIKPNRTKYF